MQTHQKYANRWTKRAPFYNEKQMFERGTHCTLATQTCYNKRCKRRVASNALFFNHIWSCQFYTRTIRCKTHKANINVTTSIHKAVDFNLYVQVLWRARLSRTIPVTLCVSDAFLRHAAMVNHVFPHNGKRSTALHSIQSNYFCLFSSRTACFIQKLFNSNIIFLFGAFTRRYEYA